METIQRLEYENNKGYKNDEKALKTISKLVEEIKTMSFYFKLIGPCKASLKHKIDSLFGLMRS